MMATSTRRGRERCVTRSTARAPSRPPADRRHANHEQHLQPQASAAGPSGVSVASVRQISRSREAASAARAAPLGATLHDFGRAVAARFQPAHRSVLIADSLPGFAEAQPRDGCSTSAARRTSASRPCRAARRGRRDGLAVELLDRTSRTDAPGILDPSSNAGAGHAPPPEQAADQGSPPGVGRLRLERILSPPVPGRLRLARDVRADAEEPWPDLPVRIEGVPSCMDDDEDVLERVVGSGGRTPRRCSVRRTNRGARTIALKSTAPLVTTTFLRLRPAHRVEFRRCTSIANCA